MIRRSAGVLGVLVASLAGATNGAAAEAPAGPRLALMRLSESRLELVTMDPSGSDVRMIAEGRASGLPEPFPLGAPGWSADGAKLAFVGASGSSEIRFDIYVQAIDGSEGSLCWVPGTRGGMNPLLSPDGHTVAFTRFKPGGPKRKREDPIGGTAVWIADLGGGVVRRITPRRPETSDVATSFSPDGSTLALTRTVRGRAPKAVLLKLSNGQAAVLARRGIEPVYSPDGSRIAFLREAERARRKKGEAEDSGSLNYTDLYVMNADGTAITRLTRTARRTELRPAWDPSGQRLSFTELRNRPWEALPLGFGGRLVEINADGSCRTEIPSVGGELVTGAVWQPGVGREAGPILC
jgi:Tol biopolymer transport system component